MTPWTAARQASLSITNSWSLLRLMSIELLMPLNHLIFKQYFQYYSNSIVQTDQTVLSKFTWPYTLIFSSEIFCVWPVFYETKLEI